MQPQDSAGTRHDTQHARHDLDLVAGLAADDLTATDRTLAQALLAACADCHALHADLIAITRAARALPAPRAPRDFRITAEQAARLRRTGWLGTLLAPFASARSAARPLAATFTTLGLVGVFVAAALPALTGGAAFIGAAPESAPDGAGGPAVGVTASDAPVPQLGPAGPSSGPDDGNSAGLGTKDNVQPTDAPPYGQSGGGDGRDLGSGETERLDATSPTNLLLIGSLALLAAGLLLFGLRFAGRRFG